MKVTQVSGFLGTGKTTLMLALSRKLTEAGGKVAMVVNEIGEVPVDGEVLAEGGMQVKSIGGGCICCEVAANLASTLSQLYREFGPDHVLLEPSGVAVPSQVKTASLMADRDASLELGPAVVLFDATRPQELLDLDGLGWLVSNQLKDADVVVLSKADAVDEDALNQTAEKVAVHNPAAGMFPVSALKGLGVEHLRDLILTWNGAGS